MGEEQQQEKRSHASGSTSANLTQRFLQCLALIGGLSLSWVSSIQFRKSIMSADPQHFYAPYYSIWFCASLMTVTYPGYLLWALCAGKSVRQEHREALNLFTAKQGTFSWSNLLAKEALFLALFLLAYYPSTQSLGIGRTSSTASIVLIMSAQTSGTWLLSCLLLRQPFSAIKLFAVLLAICGVFVVSLDGQFAGTPLGIGLCMTTGVSTAFLKVLFKLFAPNASIGQLALFLSGIGALNLTLNTGPALALVLLDWDHVEWAYVPWTELAVTAVLSLAFNSLVYFGVVVLSPLVVAIGMLFGIPLSTGFDVLFRGLPFTVHFVLGACLIAVSFILTTFPIDAWTRKWTKKRRTEGKVGAPNLQPTVVVCNADDGPTK